MTQLIGNKRTLAIEYHVINPVSMTAQARFWFENQPLGSLEDLVYLEGYVLGCLLDLENKPLLTERYQNKDTQQLFSTLDHDLESWQEDDDDFSEDARPYFLTCGTLFDCYAVFAYRMDDTRGRIMWRISCAEEDLPFQDLKNASRDMHFATFSYAGLAALITELKAVLAGGR